MKKEIESFDAVIEEIDYGVSVGISALVPEEKAETFQFRITDVSAGTIVPEPLGEEERAVRIK